MSFSWVHPCASRRQSHPLSIASSPHAMNLSQSACNSSPHECIRTYAVYRSLLCQYAGGWAHFAYASCPCWPKWPHHSHSHPISRLLELGQSSEVDSTGIPGPPRVSVMGDELVCCLLLCTPLALLLARKEAWAHCKCAPAALRTSAQPSLLETSYSLH